MSITCSAMDWIRLDSKFDSDLQTWQRPPAPGQKSSGSTWDLPRRRSPRRGVGFSVEIRLRLEGCWKNIRCFRVFFQVTLSSWFWVSKLSKFSGIFGSTVILHCFHGRKCRDFWNSHPDHLTILAQRSEPTSFQLWLSGTKAAHEDWTVRPTVKALVHLVHELGSLLGPVAEFNSLEALSTLSRLSVDSQ